MLETGTVRNTGHESSCCDFDCFKLHEVRKRNRVSVNITFNCNPQLIQFISIQIGGLMASYVLKTDHSLSLLEHRTTQFVLQE